MEILLIDNGSEDGSPEHVKANYPEVKVIRNQCNLGFAEGNNVGMSIAQGDYIMLLNNDTVILPNTVSELVKVLEEDPQIGVGAPKLLMLDRPGFINSVGGQCDIYGYANDRGIYEADNGQYDNSLSVFYACGAAMMVRRRLLEEIGLFDREYFIYHEDVDLCWRAHLTGYKITFVPSSVVYHKFGATIPSLSIQRRYLAERNRLRTVLKNYGCKSLVSIMPGYVALKLFEIAWHLLHLQPLAAYAIIRAILWNIRFLRGTWERRLIVQKKRKVRDEQILRLMVKQSIELQLFRAGFRPLLRDYKSRD
jgi:hypothetical protein